MLPRHVAVIMDGNGRWARQRGKKRQEGHRAGTEAARAIVTRCRELSIEYLTLYTFSRENWKRPREEVSFLFELLADFLTRELPTLMEQDVRLFVLGELSDIPFAARKVLGHVMKKTAGNASMTLNLALNYSGREEILRAARRLAAQKAAPDEITHERFADNLYTAGQPDPDLVIRTSGEYRLSNYLIYQSAYAELYFTETFWPDFGPEQFDEALKDYASRQRRFGKTGEQLET